MKNRMGKKLKSGSVYAVNRKARFLYEILETIEAGIELEGREVKSARRGSVSLKEGFVFIEKNEAWLVGVRIGRWLSDSMPYQPERRRKLLLKRREIDRLAGKLKTKGLALIPLRVYDSHGRIKLLIALVRGKKRYDKRERERERKIKRDINRAKKVF